MRSAVEMIGENEMANTEVFELFLNKKCSLSDMFFSLCNGGNLTKPLISFFVEKGIKKDEEKDKKYTALDLSLFNKNTNRDVIKFLIFNNFFFKYHLNQTLIESANKEPIWEGEWKDNLQFSGRGLIKMGK